MPDTYGKYIRGGVNFSHDTAESISYDNTTSGLSATDAQAAIDELASGAGGHVIVNDADTELTQRAKLKFEGVYSSDNATDEETNVAVVREMTEAQYALLSDAEKKGVIITEKDRNPAVIVGDLGLCRNGIFDRNLTKIATFNSTADVTAFLSDHSVSAGLFEDLKLGQVITINDGTYNVDWMIAGFDTNLNKGYKTSEDHPNGVTQHHVTLIPKTVVTDAAINDTATVEGGYKGSKMNTTTLPAIVTALQTVLSTHLLEQCSLLSNEVTDGVSSNYTWTTDAAIYATLLSECNIFGAPIIGNFYDQGVDTIKLPIFNFMPVTYTGRFRFWLRSVASGNKFVDCISEGHIASGIVTNEFGVRPMILLG